MTTLQQALHIFRKDARHLRLEIGGALLLTLILVLSEVQTWADLQEHGGDFSGGPMDVVLPLIWALLIARSIQTEALPGDRHFWLTRPYSRTGLVLAKAFFVAAFINLPLLIAQAAIVVIDGLPLSSYLGGLLWNQVLITALLVLPAAAIAALTRNLAQFLPIAVIVGGMLVGAATGPEFSIEDLNWVRSSIGFLVVVAVTSLAVWRQYRLRRSGNTALVALGTAVAGLIFYLSFPQSAAFAIQSTVVGTADSAFGLRLGEPRAIKSVATVTPNRYRQLLELPVTVTGTDAQNLEVRVTGLAFKTLSGVTRKVRAKVEVSKLGLIHTANVDRDFFNAAKDSPVTVHAEYYVTQYADERSTDVPLDGTPVFIPGLGQCGAAVNYDNRSFVCRSAFRNPGWFVSDRLVMGPVVRRWWGVYSPFPADVVIHPVIARSFELSKFDGGNELAPAAPEKPATLVSRKPVAYFRYTLDVPNVRLANYAIPEPKEESTN
ncbi:MAG: hypothetical protein ABIR70_16335 [Bryobacteraceae bacterium]